MPEDHVQSADNIFGFHVQFATNAETIKLWQRVYQGELSRLLGDTRVHTWVLEQLNFDDEYFSLHELAHSYDPGIHLVNIDLVAHWEPKDGRTLIQVREQAKSAGEILAQLEVVSIYGVLTELFMQQDGENLPYSDMPGTDVKVPGGSDPYALYVSWHRAAREAEFHAHWVGYVDQRWAAPVLRELAAQAA